MVSTAEERAQFKVPASLRLVVRNAALAEDVAESVVWRRVVKAGIVALGLDPAVEPAKVEILRAQLSGRGTHGESPVVPVSTQVPAGWDVPPEPDPLDSIA